MGIRCCQLLKFILARISCATKYGLLPWFLVDNRICVKNIAHSAVYDNEMESTMPKYKNPDIVMIIYYYCYYYCIVVITIIVVVVIIRVSFRGGRRGHLPPSPLGSRCPPLDSKSPTLLKEPIFIKRKM